MVAFPLPPGLWQFADQNGAPYAGGTVYTYIPGGTTPKTTWQDPTQTVPNTNPIVLDAAGRANIWGAGIYRQQLYDLTGNLVWDTLTDASNGGVTVFVGDSGAGGAEGLVPAPPAGSAAAQDYLSANGSFGPLLVVVPTAPDPKQAGLLFVPPRQITATTGALALTDAGGAILYTNAAPGVLTITKDATANWLTTVLTQILIRNQSTANLTLARDSGVNLLWPGTSSTSSNRVLAGNGQCLLTREGTNAWTVVGAGLS